VLEVAAGKMHGNGYLFFQSENGVWLTDSVPSKYLRPF
jgi:putative RNA 2'-phosphotransferase